MENKKNFYINGKWVTPKSKEEIKVIDPATEENCAVITLGNKDDVNDAVNAEIDLLDKRMKISMSNQKDKVKISGEY